MNQQFTAKQRAFLDLWASRPYRTQAEVSALVRVKPQTVSLWKREQPEFWAACGAARKSDQDALRDEEMDNLRNALPHARETMILNLASESPAVRHGAAVWLLERMLGKAPDTLNLTGADGGPVRLAHDLSGLTDEELNALERIVTRIERNSGGAEQA